MIAHGKLGGHRNQHGRDAYRLKLHALVVTLALLSTAASLLG